MNSIPESPLEPQPDEQSETIPDNPVEAAPEAFSEALSDVNPVAPSETSPAPEISQPAEDLPQEPVLSEPPVKRRKSPWIWIVAGVLLVIILAAAGGFFWLRSFETSALKQGQDALQASNWIAAETTVDQALQYRSTGLLANPIQLVLVRGEARYHLGKTDLAMADLEEGKAVDPASARPYLLQAHIQYDQGKLDKALEYTAEAQKRDDKLDFPYALQALKAYKGRDYAGAFTLAGKAIDRNTTLDFPYLIRGAIFSIRSETQAALKDLDRAAELKPKDAEILAWRAFTYYQDCDKQKALTDAASAQSLSPAGADGLWAQALTSLINYKYEDGLAAINKAIALDGSRPEFYVLRGMSYYKAANFKDSQADYEKALQIGPDLVLAIYSRARILLYRYEDVNLESEASRIQNINPQSDLAPFLLSQQAFLLSDYQKALDLANQALTLAPDDDRVLTRRGVMYTSRREFVKASEDCNKALQIWPDSSYSLMCLANIEAAQKNYDKGLTLLDQALKTNPEEIDLLAFKARLLMAKKENEQAKTVLETALKIDPAAPYLLNVHSSWSASNNDNLQAISDLNKALENSPKDTDVLISRGYIYLNEGNPDRAMEDAQAALKINSRLPEVQMLLYSINMKLDKRLDALANAKSAAELDPTSPAIYLSLGQVYQVSGNNELAITNLQKSLDIEPDNVTALFLIAQAHEETGDYAAAVKDLDRLLALKSELTQDQIDSSQQLKDFFVTIPVAVNGQRTVTNTELNFTITYPVSWVPQPNLSDSVALYLAKIGDSKKITDSFMVQITPFDPNSSDALVTLPILADYISQRMASESSSYKFTSRKPIQAKSLTGIVDTFEDKSTNNDGTSQLIIGKYYFFKTDKAYFVCAYFGNFDVSATVTDEVDSIVATLGVLK